MAQLIIPDEATQQTYTVGAPQTAFPFSFAVFTKADLRFSVGAIELAQSDFTLSGTLLDGGGYQGGTVNLNAAVTGVTCTMWRETATTRTSNFSPAPTVPVRDVDVALNRLVAMAQDQRRDILAGGGGLTTAGVTSVNSRTGIVNLTALDVTSGFGALMATNLTAGANITLTTSGGVTTVASSGGGAVASVAGRTGAVTLTAADVSSGFGTAVAAELAAGTNVTLSVSGGVTTINASLAGGTVSSVAGSSVTGELVLFNGTSGASIKNSSCVPSANGLSLLAAANYAAMLTLLGVTTAGTTALGTSGATVPLLSTANTWTLAQTFTVAPVFTNQAGTRTALGLGSVAVLADASTLLAAGAGVSLSTSGGVTTISVTGGGAGTAVYVNSAVLNVSSGSPVALPTGAAAGDVLVASFIVDPTGGGSNMLYTQNSNVAGNRLALLASNVDALGYNIYLSYRQLTSADISDGFVYSPSGHTASGTFAVYRNCFVATSKGFVDSAGSATTLVHAGFTPDPLSKGVIELSVDLDTATVTLGQPTSWTSRLQMTDIFARFNLSDRLSGYTSATLTWTGFSAAGGSNTQSGYIVELT